MEQDKNTLLWILIAAVVLLFLSGEFGMGGYGMMGSGMGAGLLVMLLFLGAIILLIVALTNTVQSSKNDESQDSLAILKKRYAKGEITKKQYEEMKKELKS